MQFNFAGSLPFIVGPFTLEEMEALKKEPLASLKVSKEEMKKVRSLIKSIRF